MINTHTLTHTQEETPVKKQLEGADLSPLNLYPRNSKGGQKRRNDEDKDERKTLQVLQETKGWRGGEEEEQFVRIKGRGEI